MKEFAEKLNGDYIEGVAWHGDRVEIQHDKWIIIFDTHTFYSAAGSMSVSKNITRVRAPFQSQQDFRFLLFRNTLWGSLSKLFGAQDVIVGDPAFDKAFVIKGNDESKIRELFSNARLKELIQAQDNIHLEITTQEGYFGEDLPQGQYELFFMTDGVVNDIRQLELLYELFKEVMDQFQKMGWTE
ncbi:MAG: hypothetical protein K0R65_857 [Crocinitomicaceae bacterium]|nr:hypothetical protein [Crocinitomicaceae bacterium]